MMVCRGSFFRLMCKTHHCLSTLGSRLTRTISTTVTSYYVTVNYTRINVIAVHYVKFMNLQIKKSVYLFFYSFIYLYVYIHISFIARSLLILERQPSKSQEHNSCDQSSAQIGFVIKVVLFSGLCCLSVVFLWIVFAREWFLCCKDSVIFTCFSRRVVFSVSSAADCVMAKFSLLSFTSGCKCFF